MNRKTIYACLPAVIFVLFLAVMTLLLAALPSKDYSENEKRYLAQFPQVSGADIMDGSFQKNLESWTADQVPGRDLFVGVNAYWSLATGRNGAQDIYHCADGYLINAPKEYNEQIFTDNLTRFDQFAAGTGVPADLIMVPSTGYLMEDRLPFFHGVYHDDHLYEKAAATLQYVNLLDVRQTLKDGLAGGQVCYRTDHHLTAYGNYLLYRAYQNRYAAPYLSRDAYSVTPSEGFYGTTWSGSGYWATDPDTVELWDSGMPVTVTIHDSGSEDVTSDSLFFPAHLEDLDQYPVYLDGNHSLVTIHNDAYDSGSLLVIRDSYAHCFATFLAAHYQNVYLVDYRYFRDSASAFLAEHPVDRVLYLYGVDNLVSDTNSAWLN